MGVLKIFAKKQRCWSLFLKACNFIKKRFQNRCFSLKFAKFFKAPILTEHLRWLLLHYDCELSHFMPLVFLYLLKHKKASSFLMFSGGVDQINGINRLRIASKLHLKFTRVNSMLFPMKTFEKLGTKKELLHSRTLGIF